MKQQYSSEIYPCRVENNHSPKLNTQSEGISEEILQIISMKKWLHNS